MTTNALLRIDASARREGSASRLLGDDFVARWTDAHPGSTVTVRDLVATPVEQIRQDTIRGYYTTPEAMDDVLRSATALSDRLIGELRAADELLLTVPLYNFAIPSSLKAWIDQVVRIGHTFSYEDGAFAGLLRTRRATVVASYGACGYLEGEAFRAANFLEPYLDFVLRFVGVPDVRFVDVQGTTGSAVEVEAAMRTAHDDIARLPSVAASTRAIA